MKNPQLLGKLVVFMLILSTVGFSIYNAIPKDLSQQPFDIYFDDSPFKIDIDENGQIVPTMPNVTIVSRMPQELADVNVKAYLGNGDQRVMLATLHIPSIQPNGSTEVTQGFDDCKVSVFELLTTFGTLKTTSDGTIDLPLYVSFGFKYLEFMGGKLIDFSITVKASNTQTIASIDGPHDIEGKPNSKQIEINTSQFSTDSTVNQIVEQFNDKFNGDAGLYFDDGHNTGFEVKYDQGNEKITFSALGDESKTAVELLKNLLNSGQSEYTFKAKLGSQMKDITLDRGQIEGIINALSMYYG